MMRHLGFRAEGELRHPYRSGSCVGPDDIDGNNAGEDGTNGEAVGGRVGYAESLEMAEYGGGDSVMAEVLLRSLCDGSSSFRSFRTR
jgi:hypothetical protein